LPFLQSLLFDDIAAEVDANLHPAIILHRFGLPDGVLVFVQLADVRVTTIFNSPACLSFGKAVGPTLQSGVGTGSVCMRIG
jgi:hypothetical protein